MIEIGFGQQVFVVVQQVGIDILWYVYQFVVDDVGILDVLEIVGWVYYCGFCYIWLQWGQCVEFGEFGNLGVVELVYVWQFIGGEGGQQFFMCCCLWNILYIDMDVWVFCFEFVDQVGYDFGFVVYCLEMYGDVFWFFLVGI